MKRAKDLDFTKFYYEKVATGEGCGCAERVIDVHEAVIAALQDIEPRLEPVEVTGLVEPA